jgi:aspartyl-tRNA(Asn)/glutamyl-tRNA(Gln) amidotransferase subunit B
MNYDIVIGLEVHAQMNTKSKAWCTCQIDSHALENTKVCEICSAQPGTLPVFNLQVAENAVKLGLATNCEINKTSYFDRKNYFYPDLPKGYQITQFEKPLAEKGYLEIRDEKNELKKVRIQRIQIEEDTGKSVHEGEFSLINLNRCGTPLLEIVGEADLTSATEAVNYLKKLYNILVYLEINDGNLQEGNFRCDVNLSLKPKGSKTFGTRTEVKNLNSFRNVEKAIQVEIDRQSALLDAGGKVEQQTLNFDPVEGKVKPLRSKSDAHDYRYFPEPDLLPLIMTSTHIEKVRASLPELPEAKSTRFVKEYQVTEYDAQVLTSNKYLADYFEAAAKAYKAEAKKVANWILVELLKLLNEINLDIRKSPVAAVETAALLNAVVEGKISGKTAKDVFQHMFDHKKNAIESISELGVSQVSNEGEIKSLIQKVLEANPSELARYRQGEVKLMGFFVGQVMKVSGGQANPGLLNKLLKDLLDQK